MNGFNDGIEAAANEVLRWHKESNIHAPWIGGLAEAIRALKRPEPSETNKLERVEKAIRGAMNGSEPFPRVSDLARAALKAMEQGQ